MSSAHPRGDALSDVWAMVTDLVLDEERRREVVDATGLSFAKSRALRRLVEDPLSMGELAARLGMDPPNVTAVVDDLESAGLVRRERHPTDRRVTLVATTPAGRALARRAQAVLDRPCAKLARLSTADLRELRRILSRVQ